MLFTVSEELEALLGKNAEGQGVATVVKLNDQDLVLKVDGGVLAGVSLKEAIEQGTVTPALLIRFARLGRIFFNGREAVRFEPSTIPYQIR